MHPLALLGQSGPTDLPSLVVGRGAATGRVAAVAVDAKGRPRLVLDCAPQGTPPDAIVVRVRSEADLADATVVLAPEACELAERALKEGLVVFDAECPLCRASIGQFARRDRRHRLRFLPLDSDVGRLAGQRAEVDPAGPGSLVFVGATGCLKESDAALGILAALGGAWCVAARLGRFVPRRIRDRAYRWIAARRRRLLRDREATGR